VGLKQVLEVIEQSDHGWQQSHHCGIETSAGSKGAADLIAAAIAPLWD